MKVRFTASGRIQFLAAIAYIFLAAIAYIRRDDPSAASGFRSDAERRLRRLQRFPMSGRHVPESPDLPYRELIIAPYRFFYRVEGETVWIVAVWHGAQLPQAPEA